MRKKLLMRQVSFAIMVLFFFLSCNNPETDPTKTETTDSTGKTASDTVPTMAHPFAGNLDTLWMVSDTFIKLGSGIAGNARITFRFFIDTPNNIKLNGWTGNSNSWNKPPDVHLKRGRQSPVNFGTGSYFGNLQISPEDYSVIKRKIQSSNSKYVVFGPVNPIAGVEMGQIVYKIYVTNDYPGPLSPAIVYKFLVEETGIETNPSPPKNSN